MNYQGDASQGLGSNAGIGAPDPMPELKHINETVKNIMLLDSERNTRLFQQKVADRDKLTQQILENQVHTGEISEGDQKIFDKSTEDVESAYREWGGDWNNKEGYRNYQKKVTQLQDVGAHAQTRWAMMKQLEAQKAQEPLPFKQKQIQDFIDKQNKKTFWDHINPYQQLFSYDHQKMQDSLLGGGMTTEGAGGIPEFGAPKPVTDKQTTKTVNGKTTVTDTKTSAPAKSTVAPYSGIAPAGGVPPIFSTTKKYWDYNGMQKRAQLLQIENGENAENQNQWLNLVENYDENEKKKFIESMNGRIAKYNAERGLNSDSKSFVTPVQLVPDPTTGKSKIKEAAPDFAAKTVLAGIDGNYTSSEYRFDKDAAKYRLDSDKNAILKQGVGVKWFDANTKRMAVNLKSRQVKNLDAEAAQASQTWDNIAPAITHAQTPYGEGSTVFTVDVNDLPEGSTYLGGIDNKGQPIKLIGKGAQPVYKFDKGGETKQIIGYKGGHFDVDYYIPEGIGGFSTNKKMPSEKLYDAYKKSGSAGTFKEFIDNLFKDGKLDYQLRGQNGIANRVSSYTSQKALGNKVTKKGQGSPYDQDELDLIGIDSDDNSDNSDNQ